MNCQECRGVLMVIAVEDYPTKLSTNEQLSYKRICDVECVKCGKIYYSQPYDSGKAINVLREIEKE